ncbi:CSC1-like protein 2 [Argonauta hians]
MYISNITHANDFILFEQPNDITFCDNVTNSSTVAQSIGDNFAINSSIWIICLILFSLSPNIIKDYRQRSITQRRTFSTQSTTSLSVDEAHRTTESQFPEKLQQTDEFTSWFRVFMRLSDQDIADRCGSDAVSYLRFQRYLIGYNLFILIVTVVIILPVNYIGNTFDSSEGIGRTAIINVHSNLLWLHVTISLLYLLGMIFLIFRISRHLSLNSHTSNTLLISNIPLIENSETLIKNHLNQAFPNVEIRKISSIFDTRKLLKLNKKLQVIHRIKECSPNQSNEIDVLVDTDESDQCLCCKRNHVNLSEKEEDLLSEKSIEKERLKEKPLGMVFVEVTSKEDAECIYSSLHSHFKCRRQIFPSEWSHRLKVKQWRVSYAPSKDDIIWENLPASLFSKFIRSVFVTIVLFFVCLIVTSPALIISIWQKAGLTKSLVFPILSGFLLKFLVKILPTIVVLSVSFLKSWTKSSEQKKIMKALFITLLITVLLLPSLGLTMMDFLQDFHVIETNMQCIFSMANNMLFVNYVIVSALTSTGLELLRISELLRYLWRYITVRSPAKRRILRNYDHNEFDFGEQYAWVLALFSVVITYSIIFPIISVFGCLYIILKHCVDRYNLYFIHEKSSVHKGIHVLAVHVTVLISILPQFCVLEFTILITSGDQVLSQVFYYSLAILVVSLIFTLSFIVLLYVKQEKVISFISNLSNACCMKKPKLNPNPTNYGSTEVPYSAIET